MVDMGGVAREGRRKKWCRKKPQPVLFLKHALVRIRYQGKTTVSQQY
jgi:hypothetical protein